MQRKASSRSKIFVNQKADAKRYEGYPALIEAQRQRSLRVLEDFSAEELAALQVKLREWTRTRAGRRDP